MSRRRDDRQAKALAFLRLRLKASALEIGSAACRGERWAKSPRAWHATEAVGLQIAADLVRNGIVKPTRGNLFQIA